MRHSLRLRLMLFVSALVVAALGALAFVSTRVVSQAFVQLELRGDDGGLGAALDETAGALSALYHRDGSFREAGTVVPARESYRKWAWLVVSPDGALQASVRGAFSSTRFRADGTLEAVIEQREAPTVPGRGLDEIRIQLAGPRASITDGDGRTVAYLYMVPDRNVGGSVRRDVAWSVNRGLLVAAGLAVVFALGATAVLSTRMVRPIEKLTEMAERLGRGDTAVRAPVTRRDEIGALGASFNQMADNLERLETLRRRMLGDVAHELRTPLTNVRCQLEAMQDGLVAPSAETLASLHAELLSLSCLVDDLQDLALADAGQLRLRVETIDAAAIARQVAQALTVPGGAAIIVDAPAECRLQADGDRLRQVLRNLVANALAVTPLGLGVRVGVAPEVDSVVITVDDRGPGIRPEARDFVFERFSRLDESRRRASGGAGLGLAIVRQLVELHGGTVHIEDAAGGGARFVVMLPVVK